MSIKSNWHHFSRVGRFLFIFGLVIYGRVGLAQTVASIPLLEQCAEMKSNGRIEESLELSRNSARDEASRVGAIELLGKSCDQRAVEPLIGLLGDASPRIRVAVIEALGRIGDPESVRPLIGQIDGASYEVLASLTRTLISFKVHDARLAVVNLIVGLSRPIGGSISGPMAIQITSEDDMRLRGAAVLTINELTNNIYNRKAIQILLAFQQSKDPAVARIAAETIAKLPATRSGTRELIGILKKNNTPIVKVWVCHWIGRLRLTEGREALAEVAANDRNAEVREAATAALRILTESR